MSMIPGEVVGDVAQSFRDHRNASFNSIAIDGIGDRVG